MTLRALRLLLLPLLLIAAFTAQAKPAASVLSRM